VKRIGIGYITPRRKEYGKGAKASSVKAAFVLSPMLFLSLRVRIEGEDELNFRPVFAPFLSFIAPWREVFSSLIYSLLVV